MKLSEEEFREKLLKEIELWMSAEITDDAFLAKAQVLVRNFPAQIRDFHDEELGWAHYWIQEVDYFGFDEVVKNRFDFRKLVKS